jgi:hypothetical protein
MFSNNVQTLSDHQATSKGHPTQHFHAINMGGLSPPSYTEITQLYILALTTVPRTEGRSGTRLLCGVAAPGPERTAQNTQQIYTVSGKNA